MSVPNPYAADTSQRSYAVSIIKALAWSVAIVAAVNTLYFVLRATTPVFRDDDWYFLDVFLRKAIDGTLTPADFFVRRMGSDHSQPLFKLVLLLEWRYLGSNPVPGALLAVITLAGSSLIYLRLLTSDLVHTHAWPVISAYLAWAAISALLFSLNGGTGGQWVFALSALENVTNLIILLFWLAIWHAHRSGRYLLLIIATLFVAGSSDDSAVIAAIAGLLALLLMRFADRAERRRSFGRVVSVIVVCMIIVGIGYRYAPIIGGVPSLPLVESLRILARRFAHEGWWEWAVYVTSMAVASQSPWTSISTATWRGITIAVAVVIITAQVWFWRRAFRATYDRAVFIAVATMLATYGWIAGIVLDRVTVFGNDYLLEPRYTLLFAGQLVALLLMWARTRDTTAHGNRRATRALQVLPVTGCAMLLAIQIPLSTYVWRARPYLIAYYVKMALQIDALAAHPYHVHHCVPELPVCEWPATKRAELTGLMSSHRLNVFSPQVQALYHYLPRLQPVRSTSTVPSHDNPHADAHGLQSID